MKTIQNIQTTNRVEVYKNLRLGCWSVRDLKTGKVIDHTAQIYIKDAELVVHPAGRARVLKTRQKNVHAFVRGYIDTEAGKNREGGFWRSPNLWRATYNPYSNESFVVKGSIVMGAFRVHNTSPVDCPCSLLGTPIHKADRVCLAGNGELFVEVN